MGHMYSECIMYSIMLEGTDTLKARNHVRLLGCRLECREEIVNECKHL